MNDVFDYVIKPYLDSKEVGWSPFELHIVPFEMPVGTKIINSEFKSFRCLLKRSIDVTKSRYYDMTPSNILETGRLPCVFPRLMKIRNVYTSYDGITSYGDFTQICYIVIINRSTKSVMSCSGALFPMSDRLTYVNQFSNMFKKFDSVVVESNMESIIRSRFSR
jgi:hypothetical protein